MENLTKPIFRDLFCKLKQKEDLCPKPSMEMYITVALSDTLAWALDNNLTIAIKI